MRPCFCYLERLGRSTPRKMRFCQRHHLRAGHHQYCLGYSCPTYPTSGVEGPRIAESSQGGVDVCVSPRYTVSFVFNTIKTLASTNTGQNHNHLHPALPGPGQVLLDICEFHMGPGPNSVLEFPRDTHWHIVCLPAYHKAILPSNLP